MENLKLYLVHVGFYDDLTSFGGVYEAHSNLFVVAESAQEAKSKAKALDIFKSKRMHIDGIQEIKTVGGYRISLTKNDDMINQDDITPHVFRDLASTNPA